MLFHQMTEDQKALLEEVTAGRYKSLWPHNTSYAYRGMTYTGLEFEWLHGLGDGEDVRLQGVTQPRWFGKKLITLLERDGIGE